MFVHFFFNNNKYWHSHTAHTTTTQKQAAFHRMVSTFQLLMALAMFVICTTSFLLGGKNSAFKYRNNMFMTTGSELVQIMIATQIPSTPETEKSQLSLILSGPMVNSAIFRAGIKFWKLSTANTNYFSFTDLKKELTFFRGCGCVFRTQKQKDKIIGEICAEGKTKQLARFIEWCMVLTTPLATRKPNFQGPSILLKLETASWNDYTVRSPHSQLLLF